MLTKSEMIAKMRFFGYHYDEINSYDEWIVFTFEGGKIEFDCWFDVNEWLNEVSD